MEDEATSLEVECIAEVMTDSFSWGIQKAPLEEESELLKEEPVLPRGRRAIFSKVLMQGVSVATFY